MTREKFFAISVFLRAIYTIIFFLETYFGVSYVFTEGTETQVYCIVFRSLDIITIFLLVISAFRLRQVLRGGKYTAFIVLILIGLIFSTLSNIATITAAFLYDPLQWYLTNQELIYIYQYIHLGYIGVTIFCFVLNFVAWILFEKYMKQKEQKKLARLSKYMYFSFFIVILGLGIILTKDILFYNDSFPRQFNDLPYLINNITIAHLFDIMYLGGVLVSCVGLLISILSHSLVAMRLLTHPITHTEPFTNKNQI